MEDNAKRAYTQYIEAKAALVRQGIWRTGGLMGITMVQYTVLAVWKHSGYK